jgi:hypothetical protein
MTKEERIKLLRALAAASNAFHDTLREKGYSVSYGYDNFNTGSIRKNDCKPYENWSLGDLTISWKLKD